MPAETVPRERTISHLLRYFESLGSGDSFRRMCILDALILNSDRHIGNFGVLYDNDTMQVQRMAPVFDNNRSMLFDLDNDQLKKPRSLCAALPERIRTAWRTFSYLYRTIKRPAAM